ncbi:MAG TPA: phytanoyl-CoA dioxygenase family protein [Rhizomicrobium sp.]|nr:phytanoyl-CoA dioxygenase family protein [Rhizomicrobium sp.]
MRRDGVVAISGYWPAQRCAQARAEIDRLVSAFPAAVQNHSGGADKRMYGVESASDLLAQFHTDPFLQNFGELICSLDLYNFATLGAHIVAGPHNRGSGDGWHRDAHGFQFKSILYLSDTTSENGPFEYLTGSHKDWRVGVDTALADLPGYPNTRFTNEQIEALSPAIGGRRKSFPADAGTLLLVNTSGIHRGQPLTGGTRYALTNYYYHRCDIDEARLQQFSPMIPGTAERIRRDLLENPQ